MKLKHLFTAAAACTLMAGAAYAQSTGSPSSGAGVGDNTAAGASSAPSTGADQGGGMSSAPSPSTGASGQTGTAGGAGMSSGATGAETGGAANTGATGAETGGAANTSATVQTLTNGPIPDTPENRARYGGPRSSAGRRTAAKGN